MSLPSETKGIWPREFWRMSVLTRNISFSVAISLSLIFASSSLALAQTVVFKQPPAVPQAAPEDIEILQAKILELKNINAQLAERAKSLEVLIAGMKVAPAAKPRKKKQVCRRWKNHKCNWLVWK
jgi:hypothetical protein